MVEYRVYFIDVSGGIADAQWLHASTDEQAISEAKHLKSQFTREIWQKQREVGRLQPSSGEAWIRTSAP